MGKKGHSEEEILRMLRESVTWATVTANSPVNTGRTEPSQAESAIPFWLRNAKRVNQEKLQLWQAGAAGQLKTLPFRDNPQFWNSSPTLL